MHEPTVSARANRQAVYWIAIVLLGAWMLHPVLTPAHVEGFSASIVSLALHLNAGHLADYDRLHPVNLEYFTLSRLGTVALLSVLTGPLGLSGEWAMRVIMWLGFAALATSSFILVRRWTHAPGIVVVVALLLIPGLAESSFFYNDTIFAAALGTTALAVLSSSAGPAAAVVSGVLFGSALVARLDAVLLAPAVALIGYEQHGFRRPFWTRALVFTLGALLPVVLVPAAVHATILDVVASTRYAIVLWGDGFRPAQHARELSLFLGIPAAVLVALGCVGLTRRHDYRRLLLLVGVPVLFNLVALGKIWQSRQLLPMTPFLAALAVVGWQHVASASRQGAGRSLLERTVLFVCVLVSLAPVLLVVTSDGPRAPYGRVWTPALWRRWQNAVDSNQAEIRSLVASSRADSSAIITDTWDADRYLHLALQESGFHELPDDSVPRPCQKAGEAFGSRDRRILHIRLHQPFLQSWPELAAARLEMLAQPCLDAWPLKRVLWLAPLAQLQEPTVDSLAADLPADRAQAITVMRTARYSPQVAVELLPSALEALRRAYLSGAAQGGTDDATRRSPSRLLEDADRLMAPRVWKSAPGSP